MKKTLQIGALTIGAGAPIRVESMLKTRLYENLRLKESLKTLNENSPLPLMADIHFDPDIAVAAIEAGCPSIRINPGNMGSPERLTHVVELARERGVVIRIGANSGSVKERRWLWRFPSRWRCFCHANSPM